MIHVECPDCSKSYDVAEELAGKAAKCKACGGRIPIPVMRSESAADAGPKPASEKSNSASSKSPTLKPDRDRPIKSAPSTSTSSSTKPRPSAKKPKADDFFEDDFDEVEVVEDFDDIEEVEDFGPTPRRRASSGKPKKKKSGGGLGGFTKALGSLAGRIRVSPFVVVILAWLGFGIAAAFHPLEMAVASIAMFCVGCVMVLFAGLWMTVVTFRVSVGWGCFFILMGMVNAGIAASGHPQVGVIVNLVGFLLNVMLVIENWDEYRATVKCLVLGVLVMYTPLFTKMGFRRDMQQQFERDQPSFVRDAKPDVLFDVASIPTPKFRELGRPTLQKNGYRYYFAEVDRAELSVQTPGTLMQMSFYLPVGADETATLPCVLIASAGTTLLHGAAAPNFQYDAEFQPYLAAGFAVLSFSLDGVVLNKERATDADFTLAYRLFRNSGAGMVNVRNAVEFLIQKVPQVDPNRIYIAGHSSAATLALLAAEHEPRLKGCIAYAPATDVVARLKNAIEDPAASRLLPGVADFAKQSSPLTHVSKVGCPVFLFHAGDDSNVLVADSRRFAELLKSNRKTVEYVEVPTGNHYDSMIQQGIPRAIVWLKQLARMSDSPSAAATAAAVPSNRPNSAVPKGAELPTVPFVNPQLPPNVARQPSGRVVTYRFQSFSGNGDSMAAARQALRDVPWADLNDLEIDADKSEIRIGQLGGSVDTANARQSLIAAGFQMLPGVSIGNKSSNAAPSSPPKNAAAKSSVAKPAATTLEDIPEKNPPANTAASKPKTSAAPSATKPAEAQRAPRAARRVAKFKYERYTGKGSSVNAAREALKRTAWADQEDIELDAKNHEIRIGVTTESPDFEQARKALQNAGFNLAPGVTTAITKD